MSGVETAVSGSGSEASAAAERSSSSERMEMRSLEQRPADQAVAAEPPVTSSVSVKQETDSDRIRTKPTLPLLRVPSDLPPPSFAQSEFETIIRRQRPVPSHGLKMSHAHTISTPHLDADWQFAGWGTVSYLELQESELASAREVDQPKKLMGVLRATSIAGNGVYGSVFYAFPALAVSSSIYSPISLTVACLLLFLFRPILLELGRTARVNGANYTYLLQFSGKAMATIGAAATLFDALATSTVSAATASAYLAGEFDHMPLKPLVLAICLLLALTAVAFISMRESSTLALGFTVFHLTCMLVLGLASVASWARSGSSVLLANWSTRPTGTAGTARAIFNGVCLGFLSVTGFECTPAYIEDIAPKAYGPALWNLLCGALVLDAPLMLLVYAILPEAEIVGGANVLSLLAEKVTGRWLRIIVVIDAMLVLAGGVLTGIFTLCGLLERLARDRVLPPVFLKKSRLTNAPYASLGVFLCLAVSLYATCAFSPSTASWLFSLSFLFVMGLYALSFLLLRHNRPRLVRGERTPVFIGFTAAAVILTVLIGNIVPRPKIFAFFLAYIIGIAAFLSLPIYELQGLRFLMRFLPQIPIMNRFSIEQNVIRRIKHLKRQPVYVWVDTDSIHRLLEACLYIRNNEATSRMVFIHAYETLNQIPSELEANSKILDEAFPATTIDLVFLKGSFSPELAKAVSLKLNVPLSSCFMFSPHANNEWDLASFGGIRIMK